VECYFLTAKITKEYLKDLTYNFLEHALEPIRVEKSRIYNIRIGEDRVALAQRIVLMFGDLPGHESGNS